MVCIISFNILITAVSAYSKWVITTGTREVFLACNISTKSMQQSNVCLKLNSRWVFQQVTQTVTVSTPVLLPSKAAGQFHSSHMPLYQSSKSIQQLTKLTVDNLTKIITLNLLAFYL